MPYELLPLVAAVGLGIRYLVVEAASIRSKAAVAITVLASLVIWSRHPEWLLVATLLQVAVSIYVVTYLKVNR